MPSDSIVTADIKLSGVEEFRDKMQSLSQALQGLGDTAAAANAAILGMGPALYGVTSVQDRFAGQQAAEAILAQYTHYAYRYVTVHGEFEAQDQFEAPEPAVPAIVDPFRAIKLRP